MCALLKACATSATVQPSMEGRAYVVPVLALPVSFVMLKATCARAVPPSFARPGTAGPSILQSIAIVERRFVRMTLVSFASRKLVVRAGRLHPVPSDTRVWWREVVQTRIEEKILRAQQTAREPQ